MKVNRVLSVDYSNINNKNRVLMNKNRVLMAPSFGTVENITEKAVIDYFVDSAEVDRQRSRDMSEDPMGRAFFGKVLDLMGIFKSSKKAESLREAIEYYTDPSNNIVNKY